MAKQDSWTKRRRIIYLTLAFCAIVTAYIVVRDTPASQGVVMYLSALAGGVIGSYVFGAVWDDKK